MSVLGRLYRSETTIDFVGKRRRWFALSALLLMVALLSLGLRNMNLGVDFLGGIAVQVENPAGARVEDVRAALTPLGLEGARIQLLGDGQQVRVQTGALDPDDEQTLVETVAEVAGVSLAETSIDAVGPTFGAEITRRAIRALLVFVAVAVLFITWRFEWKMALSGIAALFHDLVLTAGIYSVTGLEVTPATVVAILTILGYSLYDTVVVFDKVRENVEEYAEELTYSSIVNRSMNEVLMRSINTSLTSLLPVGGLLFVGALLLGASTLREFALALFVGIGAGTYSSIFVASPLLAAWKEREEGWTRRRRRLEEPAPRERRAEPVTQPVSAPARGGERPPSTPSGAAPRPPKRRRRR